MEARAQLAALKVQQFGPVFISHLHRGHTLGLPALLTYHGFSFPGYLGLVHRQYPSAANIVKHRTSFRIRLLRTGVGLFVLLRDLGLRRFRIPQSPDARIKQKMSAVGMTALSEQNGQDRLRRPPFVTMMKPTNLGNRNDAFRFVPLNLTRRRGVLI